MSNIIELNNISKTFDNKKKITVLKNLNFKFKKGKIYSLSGPSGSGKSTLLNLLSLIDRPSSGNIKIDNRNINPYLIGWQNKCLTDDLIDDSKLLSMQCYCIKMLGTLNQDGKGRDNSKGIIMA